MSDCIYTSTVTAFDSWVVKYSITIFIAVFGSSRVIPNWGTAWNSVINPLYSAWRLEWR